MQNIIAGTENEDKREHTDIKADDIILNAHVLIDAKQAEDRNMATGNFTIPTKEVLDILQESIDLKDNAPTRAFAFRLANGNVWTDDFLYVESKELLKLLNNKDAYLSRNGTYWLVPRKAIIEKCRHRII